MKKRSSGVTQSVGSKSANTDGAIRMFVSSNGKLPQMTND